MLGARQWACFHPPEMVILFLAWLAAPPMWGERHGSVGPRRRPVRGALADEPSPVDLPGMETWMKDNPRGKAGYHDYHDKVDRAVQPSRP